VIINKGRLVANSSLSALRKELHGGAAAIRVSFRETLEPGTLEQLKQVEKVSKLNDHEWELQTSEPDAVKKQLLELALQNNWNILTLQSENQSLEAIFRSLTK
jgi:ABC-2 type transport system ATP-binding protein